MVTSSGYITTEDGSRLFFEKAGDSPQTVIILNGFCLLEDFKYLAAGRTLIALDLRNRGRSDFITDSSKLHRGIHQDVDDIEAVRQYFGIDRIGLIGHSYTGLIVVLYAMKYASHADRVVQIGAAQPNSATKYPPHLMNADDTHLTFFSRVQELEKQRSSTDPTEFCKQFWSLLRPLYVANPDDADKIHWDRCDLPTELNLMKYWLETIQPSIQSVRLTAEDLAGVKSPVLTVHGRKDRSASYGGGRDWASMLPNARLLTVEGAAHAPWIEAPEQVLGPIQTFLDGEWPDAAQSVIS